MIGSFTILLSATVVLPGVLVRLWILARRARTGRRQHLRKLEMELSMDALETFRQEVFRLKHYRVVPPKAPAQNAGLIPSTKVSSLRYIKGRQNED